MADTLTVHVNRDGINSVATPDSFTATGGFVLRIENHGEPAHVHLRFDDDLRAVAEPAGTNHFLPGGEANEVSVAVRDGGTGSGTLAVVTGHGAERSTVAVTVEEPETVAVDDSLRQPRTEPPTRDRPDPTEFLPAVLAALVVVGVVIVALFADESAALALGLLAVAGGAAAAAYLLQSS